MNLAVCPRSRENKYFIKNSREGVLNYILDAPRLELVWLRLVTVVSVANV